MTIHILGCGPAGLAAAHAAATAGHDIRIFSRPRQSHMFGAQYLHAPITGIECGDPVTVSYVLIGTANEYRSKVYAGTEYQGKVSPEDLDQEHQAWNIRRAYDNLWRLYGGIVEEAEISTRWMIANAKALRPMITSVPLPVVCMYAGLDRHHFSSATIWAAGEAPSRGIKFGRFINGILLPDNAIICNGHIEPNWYRASRIFGHATIEWPWRYGPTAEASSVVHKPITNDCDCWPGMLRVGRYGRWEKGVLVHHAYEETEKWLASL